MVSELDDSTRLLLPLYAFMLLHLLFVGFLLCERQSPLGLISLETKPLAFRHTHPAKPLENEIDQSTCME